MSETEVLMVGAGPVGLAMGIECVRHGLQFRLIDKLSFFSGKRPIYRDVDLLEPIRLAVAGCWIMVRILGVWAGDQPPREDWFLDDDLAAHSRYGVDQASLYLIRPDGYVGARAQPASIPAVVGYLRRLR